MMTGRLSGGRGVRWWWVPLAVLVGVVGCWLAWGGVGMVGVGGWWGVVAREVMVAVLGVGMCVVVNGGRLATERRAWVGVVYGLLAAGVAMGEGMWPWLAGAVCVLLAVGRLQAAVMEGERNGPLFEVGMWLAAGVAVCPKLVAVLAWGMVVLLGVGRGRLKDWVAWLLGVLMVGWGMLAWWVWEGDVAGGVARFVAGLERGMPFWEGPAWWAWGVGLMGLGGLVGLARVLSRDSMLLIARRRGLFSLFLQFLVMMAGLFVVPVDGMGVVLVMGLPLAGLLGCDLAARRGRWGRWMRWLVVGMAVAGVLMAG